MAKSVKDLFENIKQIDDYEKSVLNNVVPSTKIIRERLSNPDFLAVLFQPCFVDKSINNVLLTDLTNKNIIELESGAGGYWNGVKSFSYDFKLTKDNSTATILDFLFKNAEPYFAFLEGSSKIEPKNPAKSYGFFLDKLLDFYGKSLVAENKYGQINDNRLLREFLNESALTQALLNAGPNVRKRAVEMCPELYQYLPKNDLQKYFETMKAQLNSEGLTPTQKYSLLVVMTKTIFPGHDFSVNITEALANSPKSEYAKEILKQFSALYVSDQEVRSLVYKPDLKNAFLNVDVEGALELCPALFDFLPREAFKENPEYYQEIVMKTLLNNSDKNSSKDNSIVVDTYDFTKAKIETEKKYIQQQEEKAQLEAELKSIDEELSSLQGKKTEVQSKINHINLDEGK